MPAEGSQATERSPGALPAVLLAPGTAEDEWLTVALETDPRVMAELGGPHSEEFARAAHRRRIASIRDHGTWWFTIRRATDGEPVGTIGVWTSEVHGQSISETGWMTRPEHQGQGYASAALAAVLDRAAAEGRWGDIHAFPGASNAPSNALCRRFGFEHLGEVAADYAGRQLRCNHWVLRAADPGSGRRDDVPSG